MKIYLDTNIVIYMLAGENDNIDGNTWMLLTDPENLLYTSSVCVQELVYLKQKGKVFSEKKRHKDGKTEETLVDRILRLGAEIVPFNEHHLRQLEQLPLLDDKCDPNDRAIIAQAISDQAVLVSSDREFVHYLKYGLNLHQNFR
ncbi:MAG: PIN domain-containing protein [Prevotella sp.]|nr:PIN domain-containing protein [Prevotella sp.]